MNGDNSEQTECGTQATVRHVNLVGGSQDGASVQFRRVPPRIYVASSTMRREIYVRRNDGRFHFLQHSGPNPQFAGVHIAAAS
jgi:hypothetical protein